MLKAGYRKSYKYQGLDCYVPVVKCYEGNRLLWTHVPEGDPLVSAKDALKYAQIEIRDILWKNKRR